MSEVVNCHRRVVFLKLRPIHYSVSVNVKKLKGMFVT
jgi:hypothetical protein